MINIRFYPNKQKTTRHNDYPVYMSITFNGQRLRKPVTGVHVDAKNWDNKKERIKRSTKGNPFDEVNSFNNRLDQLEAQIKLIQQTAFDKRIQVSEKYILDRLNDENLIKADQHEFFSVVDQYMNSIRSVKAKWTMKGKQTSFKFLRDFERDCSTKISFQKLNLEFFEALRDYAFQGRKVRNKNGEIKDGTIEDNTFAKVIAVLKAFLNWAFDRGYLLDQNYKKFRAPERQNEIICLTLDEFVKLSSHHFKSRKLDYVRDIYIFGCSTGLRFSDLRAINSTNIQNDFIVFNTQKTRENNMIPLNKYSKAILEKYKGTAYEPLPKISNQKLNQYIKECCKEVGIDTPMVITRFSGGNRKEFSCPKHEMITSHTARKTFITLSLLLGVPERVVKMTSGHRKEENFRLYVNFSREYEKQQMDKGWDKI
jgi:integrase